MKRPSLPTENVRGIVTRVTPYRDSDLIVSILSETYGLLGALAQSARSSRRRFPGGIDLFDCAEFKLIHPKSTGSLFKAVGLEDRETWLNLRRVISLFRRGNLLLEIVQRLAPEGDVESRLLYPILHRGLRRLNNATTEGEELQAWLICIYEALTCAGYSPLEHQKFFGKDELDFMKLLAVENPITASYDLPFQRKIAEHITLYVETDVFNAALRSR